MGLHLDFASRVDVTLAPEVHIGRGSAERLSFTPITGELSTVLCSAARCFPAAATGVGTARVVGPDISIDVHVVR